MKFSSVTSGHMSTDGYKRSSVCYLTSASTQHATSRPIVQADLYDCIFFSKLSIVIVNTWFCTQLKWMQTHSLLLYYYQFSYTMHAVLRLCNH